MTVATVIAPPRGVWKLSDEIAGDVQKLVSSGFGDLPAACALLLSAGRPGGGWLAALEKVAPVTASDVKAAPAIALAFTSLGLRQIGVRTEIMADFSLPFVEGMLQKDRRHRLGDVDRDGGLFPVTWGVQPELDDAGADVTPAETVPTQPPVHALLLIYHETHPQLAQLVDETVLPALSDAGVTVARRIALDLKTDGDDVREHFGFVDGISQPVPYGEGTADGTGKQVTQDPLHGVPLGEILLGHADRHANTTNGPFIAPQAAAVGGFVPSKQAPSVAAVEAVGNPTAQPHDLGRNGSYLAVRELLQHVDAFWESMGNAAQALNLSNPGKPPVNATWIAERVVGRTRDGDMLRPRGPLPPGSNGPDNDFLYFQEDRYGFGCPMGSHVRRANPRDGLASKAGDCEHLLASANAHRILRRGRKFGGGIGGPDVKDDTQGKGLLFICLNGDISRQFEFVQQNWLLNPNFATLFEEVDPLVGPEGPMTLPAQPLRRRVHVKTFVTLVGGDYFFLPSISTLRVLAAL